VNGQNQQPTIGIGWITLLVLILFVLKPIPDPIGDAIVAIICGYQALMKL
jgi:hypothetical protein